MGVSATIVGGMDAPVLSLSRTRFNFRNVMPGESKTKTLTITNNGAGDLEATLALEGDDVFSIDDEGAEIMLGPDGSEEIDILFSPSETGDYSSYLVVSSNDPRKHEARVMILGSSVTELVCARVEVVVDPETEGEVEVVGFVDEDDDVDYYDFFSFADVFDLTEDDLEFNYRADLDCNAHINLADFMEFSDGFGTDLSN